MCNTLNIKALELYCNIKKWNIELDTLISNAINQTTKQPDNTNAFLFIILFLNITTKSQNHNIKH